MHRNNFDFLRLLFSVFVLWTHCYVLKIGMPKDFLYNMTNGQVNLADIGLKGFFVISGYLVFRSALLSKTWVQYMVKRILRIYPAYFISLTVAVLTGYIVSGRPAHDYFTDGTTLSYIPRNLLLFTGIQQFINGVFETNPNPCIQGTIWTIPHEFFYYIIIGALFLYRKFSRFLFVMPLTIFAGLFLWLIKNDTSRFLFIPGFPLELHNLSRFGLYFMAGALLYIWDIHRYKYKSAVFAIAFALMIGTLFYNMFSFAQFFLLPPLVIIFGSLSTPGISGLSDAIGDLSYGTYLYGFLIQQVLIWYFRFDYLQLMIISTIAAFICGAASWYLIERKALDLKRVIVKI